MQHNSFTLTFPSTHFKTQGKFSEHCIHPLILFLYSWFGPKFKQMFNFYWWSFSALLAWSAPSHDAQQCWSVCCKFINQLCIISLGQKLIIEFQQEPLSSTLTIQSCIYLLLPISPHPWGQQVYKGPRGKESLVNCWPLMQNWMGCECNLFNSWCLNV